MARGRPAKSGKRTKSGRLKRNSYEIRLERPSPWVAEQQKRFGVHYCWALGRAYAAGLLGEGTVALSRYQAAKRFVRLYQRFLGGSAYTCPLDNSPRGGNVVSLHVSEHQEGDRQWLKAAMDSMDLAGCRPYFDQLVSVVNIDRGPHWLDSMVSTIDWNLALPELNTQRRQAGKPALQRKDYHHGDQAILAAAIQALDIIAPEEKPARILVAHY